MLRLLRLTSTLVRSNWLRFGDCNSQFFHASIKKANTKRTIQALRRDDDSWCYDSYELKDLVRVFFETLYTDDNVGPSPVLPTCNTWKLTAEHRAVLDQPVTKEKVRSALFCMDPNQSPGVDGFSGFVLPEILEVGDSLFALVDSAFKEGTPILIQNGT